MFNKRKPCSLVIPSVFEQCLTYPQQIAYLNEYKQNVLVPGNNIRLVENDDGTVTISATGEAGSGNEYTIVSVTPDQGYSAAYQLKNVTTGEQIGVVIKIPEVDTTAISAEIETINGEISAINSSITGINKTVTDLSGQVTTVETDLENLKKTTDTNINGLNSAITDLNETVTDNSGDIAKIEADVVTLQTGKQEKLTAGPNITIENNVISASGSSQMSEYTITKTAGEATDQYNLTKDGVNTGDSIIVPTQAAIEQITENIDDLRNESNTQNNLITELQATSTANTEAISSINDSIGDIQTKNTQQDTSIQGLRYDLNAKQDQLTAGPGISIEYDRSTFEWVITATGSAAPHAEVEIELTSTNFTPEGKFRLVLPSMENMPYGAINTTNIYFAKFWNGSSTTEKNITLTATITAEQREKILGSCPFLTMDTGAGLIMFDMTCAVSESSAFAVARTPVSITVGEATSGLAGFTLFFQIPDEVYNAMGQGYKTVYLFA